MQIQTLTLDLRNLNATIPNPALGEEWLDTDLSGVKATEKKPIYKRWWFWGIIAVAGGGAAVGLSGGGEKDQPLPRFPPPPN